MIRIKYDKVSPFKFKFCFQGKREKETAEKPFSIQLQDHLFVFQVLISQLLIPGNRFVEQKLKISPKTNGNSK